MKIISFSFMLCAGLLTLSACAPSSSPTGNESELTGTVWSLSTLRDQTLVTSSNISAIFTSNGKIGGSSGCNSYSGTYTVDGDEIQISSPLASTLIACPEEIAAQETAYLATLAEVRTYSISGNQLTLNDASQKSLLVYEAQSQDLSKTSWQATGYNNGKQAVVSVMAGTSLTATFGTDGTLSGNSGCNEYNGPYKVDGNRITIGPLVSTRMACSSPEGVMEQEALYQAALQSAAVYRIESNTLELRTQDGALAANFMVK